MKKEILAQVFFWEICENSKNIFFTEYLWATVSRITPNFKVFPKTTSNFLERTTLKNDNAGIRLFKLRVL